MRNTPPPDEPPAAFTAEDLAVIRREVRAFVVAHPEVRWEFDDLVQELSVHWIERLPDYDASRGAGRGTFLRVVVRHGLADIRKGERSRKRRVERRAVSLNQPVDDDDPESASLEALIEGTVSQGDPEQALEQTELQAALQRARDRLRREVHRELFDRLLTGFTPTEMAEMTGAPRSTVDSRIKTLLDLLRADLKDMEVG